MGQLPDYLGPAPIKAEEIYVAAYVKNVRMLGSHRPQAIP